MKSQTQANELTEENVEKIVVTKKCKQKSSLVEKKGGRGGREGGEWINNKKYDNIFNSCQKIYMQEGE